MSLDNSKFRELALASSTEKKESAPKEALSAEERARRKEKQQAAYERRMAIEKRRKEALQEASRYTDRAAERRKAETQETKDGGESSYLDGMMKNSANPWEVDEETKQLAFVPEGPTFAQLGEREDLSQQQHRVSIAQSKYLGGDIEHTHLVKGLDFALLQKTRAELQSGDSKSGKGSRADAMAPVDDVLAIAKNRAVRRQELQHRQLSVDFFPPRRPAVVGGVVKRRPTRAIRPAARRAVFNQKFRNLNLFFVCFGG